MSAASDMTFEAERSRLLGLAYRILGSYADAEDVVQEVGLRWLETSEGEIDNPAAWLTRVCSRYAIDTLRKVNRAREGYPGEWLPTPVESSVTETPEADLERAQSITAAFLVTLETLSPRERAAFLLHDVFGRPYDELSECLDIRADNCRQIVARARRKLRGANANALSPSFVAQDAAVSAFRDALETGNTKRLEFVLTSDARLVADGGGNAPALSAPLVGNQLIGQFVSQILRKTWAGAHIVQRELNAARALVAIRDGKVMAAVMFELTQEGQAETVYVVRNPDKLAHLSGQSEPEGRTKLW